MIDGRPGRGCTSTTPGRHLLMTLNCTPVGNASTSPRTMYALDASTNTSRHGTQPPTHPAGGPIHGFGSIRGRSGDGGAGTSSKNPTGPKLRARTRAADEFG